MAEASSSRNYNMRNPAVKRILQEVKEMAREPSTEFMSMPLEEDIFEWQFAVHGPKDSEFEGGIFHGRITLPSEYPFKPPSFMLLTPSGRFETQTKICLSISNHHPEHWQPSWSVRTALVALIAFMPTKPNGAIGSLDYTKKERRALAIKSRQTPPKFGSAERQRVIEQIHEEMLKTAPPVPTSVLIEDTPGPPEPEDADGEAVKAPPQQPKAPSTPEPPPQHKGTPTNMAEESGSQSNGSCSQATDALPTPQSSSTGKSEVAAASAAEGSTAGDGSRETGAGGMSSVREAPEGVPAPAAVSVATPARADTRPLGFPAREQAPAAQGRAYAVPAVPARRHGELAAREAETFQERLLSAVAVVLVLAILFILGQKIARAYTGLTFTGGESEL